MPLPPSPRQGSIYENQTMAANKYFARLTADEEVRAAKV
jgi:hypothetical protein